VGHPGYDHNPVLVVDRVDDPVVANADSEVVTPCQLRYSGRTRVFAQPVDRSLDTFAHAAMKPVIGLNGRGMYPDVVGRPALCQLVPELGPGNSRFLVVPNLYGRKAVLEKLESINELVVAIDVD
jgi:hypothetical protein